MIAISYRRDDSLPIAGRLYDRLQAKFGKNKVFMDFDSIPPGTDFREQIKQVIDRSNLVIAVIGPNWLGQQADASRRIDNPADFVRLEIAYALKRGIPVIPVLINDTEMPSPEKLPPEIAELAFRNAVTLDTGIDFHHHADRLITGIVKAVDAAPRSGESPDHPEPTGAAGNWRLLIKIGILGSAVLLALAVSAIWFFARHPREQEENRTKPAMIVEKPGPVTGSTIISTPGMGSTASPEPTSPSEVVRAASPTQTVPQSTSSVALEGYNPGIAFVDMSRIFKEYTKTRGAEKRINESKQVAKRDYDGRADAYKKALDEINGLNRQLESENLSASVKNAKRNERDDKIAAIKKMEKEINEFRVTREKELQDEAQVMREGLVNEITARIKSEAREFEGIVFDKSGMSLNGVPVIMFTPDDADMSVKVLSGLNENQPSAFRASHDPSFAVVDMNRIFKAYHKTTEAEGRINLNKEAAKKEYDDRANSYKKALGEINELNRKLQSSSGSGTARDAMVRERDNKISDVKKMEKEINKFRETREKQLHEQATRMREGIVKEITDMIGAKLDRSSVAVVIDISGNSLNGAPLAASVRGVPDYSNEVITALNQARDKEPGKFQQPLLQSQSMRVGLVDLDRAFKSWPGTKEAETEIDEAKAAAKKEYGDKSKDVRDKKEKELQDKAKSLRDGIIAKIIAAVRADATREGFNLVFDSSGKSLNGVPVVVLASGVPDLTDNILKK